MKKFFKIGCGIWLFLVLIGGLLLIVVNNFPDLADKMEYTVNKILNSDSYKKETLHRKNLTLKDTNNDGTVSEEEEFKYEEKIKQEEIEMERKRQEEFNKCNNIDKMTIRGVSDVISVKVIGYRKYLVDVIGASGRRITKTVDYSGKPDCY